MYSIIKDNLKLIICLLFRFLVSVFYSKAKIAAACSGIIYLLTYVPCMYISIREDLAQDTIPKWAKMLAVSFKENILIRYISFFC